MRCNDRQQIPSVGVAGWLAAADGSGNQGTTESTDEFSFATELFDWKTGEQISSVTLNICVTSNAPAQECYTEKQDTQDSERYQDMQETKIMQEVKEKKEKTKALQQNEIMKKASLKKGPYIPTTDELARALEKTEGIRRGYPDIPQPKCSGMDESAETMSVP